MLSLIAHGWILYRTGRAHRITYLLKVHTLLKYIHKVGTDSSGVSGNPVARPDLEMHTL